MDKKIKLKSSVLLISFRVLFISLCLISFFIFLAGTIGTKENLSELSEKRKAEKYTETTEIEQSVKETRDSKEDFTSSSAFYSCVEAIKYIQDNPNMYNCETIIKISFYEYKEKHVLVEYVNKNGSERKVAYNATKHKGWIDASDYYVNLNLFASTGEYEKIYDADDEELSWILRGGNYGIN